MAGLSHRTAPFPFAPSSGLPASRLGRKRDRATRSCATSAPTDLAYRRTLRRWRHCCGHLAGTFQAVNAAPVAIIGAGPAGLAAAHDLALMGCRPVVFESEPVPAGMLALGIPAYRLPRELITREVAVIQALGARDPLQHGGRP